MVKRLMLPILAVIAIASVSQAQTWTPDKAHSTVGFTVKHLVITKVSGNFTDYDGKVTFDGKDFSKGSAEFTIQAKSINTGTERRDNDLRSASNQGAEPQIELTSFRHTVDAGGSG